MTPQELESVRNQILNRYPGTPHANLETLPSCHLCSQEVKPGEDYCWSCLGESQVEWEEGYIFDFTATHTMTVTKATFSSQSGYVWKTFSPITLVNGDTLRLTWTMDSSSLPSEFPTGLISVT